MAFDGITIANIVCELNAVLTSGGISRIIQPEKDELYLTVKNSRTNFVLYMSASASLPLVYLAGEAPKASLTAPNFCMLLRKHLQGGKILKAVQPSLERVIDLEIEHPDELGDPCRKHLMIEIMGKYSNIILTDADGIILDSIKRVPATMSSVREVLPGRKYFIPETQKKSNPLEAEESSFLTAVFSCPQETAKALYNSYTGISPLAAEEFCFEAGIDGGAAASSLNADERKKLAEVFLSRMKDIRNGKFFPNIIFENGEAKEFASFPLSMYGQDERKSFESVSEELRFFYAARNRQARIRERSANLRHAVTTALDRINKKAAIQEKQLLSAEKKDQYRLYGEMLNTYGYEAEEGAKSLEVINYYTNEPLTVPLDPTLSATENAQKYFERYTKLKRTESSASAQLKETLEDRDQLESILESLELAETEGDLQTIRRELEEFGWVRSHPASRGKVREEKSSPMLFRSSDGFLIAVGKNNYQNDELTFRYANGNDWWFHAKGQPGSHVILRTEGREVPDRAFEEAGALAAFYSKGRRAPKVEIDYTLRKNIRKTPAGKPGFVIYHTNYSLMAIPDVSGLERIADRP
ncbi:MAG: NFACT family protein [Lachnospiraceae bacterium]|jgi:predicted ribosome quality control (RQC) complex YloA/Tae2 family protein|nr:NFACT family protein [Lachnospiraceae bacterium]MCI1726652.1 NFACT family protein [Lachnospiraceae bacterium]